jgi:hypothetical protein
MWFPDSAWMFVTPKQPIRIITDDELSSELNLYIYIVVCDFSKSHFVFIIINMFGARRTYAILLCSERQSVCGLYGHWNRILPGS